MIKKKLSPSKNKEKSLIISSSFMLKDLFCKNSFKIQYILGNKVKATTLVNTCATKYCFIDEEFVKTVCQILEIKS